MYSFLNILFCIVGVIAGIGIYGLIMKFKGGTSQVIVKNEANILLERVEKVFKIVLAEGHFSEIYDHSSEKEILFGLTKLNKKALIVAKAKVLVGFDFEKVKITWQNESKTMKIDHFPEPEILSTDTDYKFYDIDHGLLNKFKNEDYTQILSDAKITMQNKAIASELPKIAKKQALVMLNQMAISMGWQIEYALPTHEVKHLLEAPIDFQTPDSV
ncbi:MAG: DUF4230 domain-containing protein [Pseudarcicella sp.]|jgi:hypothetical protein|nr:DUF4230 domain-containing protein [Pseudarcicella sp.]MBP6410917.1 DUF4230 domain-containing protein [Pseudarcicella sp.]